MAQIFTTTTVMKSEKVAEGEWKISEIKSDPPPEQDLHSGNRKTFQFDLAFGIGINVYYDIDDKEISATGTFGGSPIGNRYTAGLNTGIKFGVDLWAVDGEVRVYKKENSLALGYTLGGFGQRKSDDFHIMDL